MICINANDRVQQDFKPKLLIICIPISQMSTLRPYNDMVKRLCISDWLVTELRHDTELRAHHLS